MTQNLAYAAIVHADDTVEAVRRGEGVAIDVACRVPETGERALMRAVLQDAILCLRGHATGATSANERQRAAEQAYRWIASRDTTWPFAFESICHVLGLEPSSLRRRLLTQLPVTGAAAPARARAIWHEGGMVGRLRTVRMRGNQRKRTLRLRERRRRTAAHAAPRQRTPRALPGNGDAPA
jgi:hypothetical protein